MTVWESDAAGEMRRLSALADRGVTALREAADEWAHAEHAYRSLKAKKWIESATLTTEAGKPESVGARQAWVDGECATARLGRDIADGMRQAALEALRTRRQQLSALQSLLAADRAEAQIAAFQPEMVP